MENHRITIIPNKTWTVSYILFIMLLAGCGPKESEYDATGAFEADETMISAEVSGILRTFQLEEGQKLKEGSYLGFIDTTQLSIQKKQLNAQIQAILSKRPNVNVQLVSLKEQLKAAEVEQQRVKNLYNADAATAKQLDDITAQVAILKGQIEATRNNLNTSTTSLESETAPLLAQLELINEQISKSILTSPMNGTVLMTYAEQHELVAPGKPLYKIADLSTLTLKVYITGNQLPGVKLNQDVTVLTDDGTGGYLERSGTIYWISDQAEFTPKSIQTKQERADKVYAMKIRVPNDGTFKIGMYGEIKLSGNE